MQISKNVFSHNFDKHLIFDHILLVIERGDAINNYVSRLTCKVNLHRENQKYS